MKLNPEVCLACNGQQLAQRPVLHQVAGVAFVRAHPSAPAYLTTLLRIVR